MFIEIMPPVSTFRHLFDELVELDPDQRDRRMTDMAMSPETRRRLSAMLLFDEFCRFSADQKTALCARKLTHDLRLRLKAMFVDDSCYLMLMRMNAADAMFQLAAERTRYPWDVWPMDG